MNSSGWEVDCPWSAEVGVEETCAGEWGGARGEGVGHTLRRKRAVTAMMSFQQQFRVATGIC
jgi:hypothetical protein